MELSQEVNPRSKPKHKGDFLCLKPHTWASWHLQARNGCDELKELGGRKTRSMVDHYAKFATGHLATAISELRRRWRISAKFA